MEDYNNYDTNILEWDNNQLIKILQEIKNKLKDKENKLNQKYKSEIEDIIKDILNKNNIKIIEKEILNEKLIRLQKNKKIY